MGRKSKQTILSEEQENLVQELLKLATETGSLDGKSLREKIDVILEKRIENELVINSLLNVGVVYDKITVQEAAKINNKSKDSLSDLVKVIQLLEGLPTERVGVSDERNQFRMDRINRMRGLN